MVIQGDGSSRREARERAIELAYEAHIRSASTDEIIGALPIEPEPFVLHLLEMFNEHREESDRRLEAKARGWSLARMAVLDRIIMELAVAELLDGETPPGAIMSEAVELAGRYSTEDSSRFVNGVLGAVRRQLESEVG